MKDENKKAKKTKTPKEYTEEDLQNDLEKSGDFRKLYDMVFENGECIFRNEYTRKRFIQSVYWYHQSARKCKKMFYLLSIIAIVLPTFRFYRKFCCKADRQHIVRAHGDLHVAAYPL